MAGRKYGAMAPPGAEWQMGRTAADISFVNLAERYLTTATDEKEIARLREEIDAIRKGTKKLADWVTVEGFLKS